jgi:hypothetical protein
MTTPAPGPTEPPKEPPSDDGNRTMYWVVGGIAVALAIIGLFTYSAGKNDREAQQKAQQLTQKLEAAGLPVPADPDTIIRALGNDGGAVCADPAHALARAVLFDSLANGASHVGRRPVIVDRRILQGEVLILETYCPDKLQEYRDKIDELKTDDVIKD